MMQCISSVSYSIRINRCPQGNITPTRGLRQGDPLSPYLFFICAKGLSGLTKKSVQNGDMEGVAVCRDAPSLSHLFFADDSLIFYKASLVECNSLQRVLKVYEEAFGQQLNRANRIYNLTFRNEKSFVNIIPT